MPKKIKEFIDGEKITEYFVLREATTKITKNNKPFIKVVISDASGSIEGNLWDFEPDLLSTVTLGDIVKIRGNVETYHNALQLNITKMRATTADDRVDFAAFIPTSGADLTALEKSLRDAVGAVADPDYRALLAAFFDDPQMFAAFRNAPAARSNHHAWLGGLLEHTVTILRYAQALLATTPLKFNGDLLLTGVLLHDIGKVEEFTARGSIEYSDYGRLVGHITIGALMVAERAPANFPPLKKRLVQHLILSHHGKLEFGSPILPAIPEAFALHYLDNLDAKTAAAANLLAEDTSLGNWTQRSFMLESALYKGGAAEPVSSAPTTAAPASAANAEIVAPDSAPDTASESAPDLFAGG